MTLTRDPTFSSGDEVDGVDDKSSTSTAAEMVQFRECEDLENESPQPQVMLDGLAVTEIVRREIIEDEDDLATAAADSNTGNGVIILIWLFIIIVIVVQLGDALTMLLLSKIANEEEEMIGQMLEVMLLICFILLFSTYQSNFLLFVFRELGFGLWMREFA